MSRLHVVRCDATGVLIVDAHNRDHALTVATEHGPAGATYTYEGGLAGFTTKARETGVSTIGL